MMKASIWRGFTSVMVLTAFLVSDFRTGYAYPGDVFRVSTPAQAPSVEDRLTSEEETHSVGESGAAQYTIPITVPPGRQGMQPSLSLSYSSRNPLRGGLAAGWTLNIPKIEIDTSQGRLAGINYRSSLSGSRLVLVQEQASPGAEAFRAEFDSTYARYERVKNSDGSTRMWVMRSTDGRTWFFGDTSVSFVGKPSASQDVPQVGAGAPTQNGRWFLSKIVDRFGNSIEYLYRLALGRMEASPSRDPLPVDVYLAEIRWGYNPGAGLQHYARVLFQHDQNDSVCQGSNIPIGASFNYRMGYRLHEGTKRLTAISVQESENGQFAGEQVERRRYQLDYDMTELGCPTGRTHAPLRLLTSVQQTAFAPDRTPTALPPVTFEYGRRELELTEKKELIPPITGGHDALSFGKAGGWPTIDGMLLDFDGDGRLDALGSEPELDKNGVLCGMSWRRNKGDGTFEEPKKLVFLPTIPWAGPKRNDTPPSFNPEHLNLREGCSLSHQFSRVDGENNKLRGGVPPSDQAGYPATYNSYRFMDVTGDGRPDLVTAIDTNRGKYHPESDTRLWPSENPFPVCLDQGPCRDGRSGYYLVAEGGGGREVKADRQVPLEWETFTIRKIQVNKEPIKDPFGRIIGYRENILVVDGPIGFNEPLALQAHNGAYVVAEGGGNGEVKANRSKADKWETFLLEGDQTKTVQIKTINNSAVIFKQDGTVYAGIPLSGSGNGSRFTLIDLNGGGLQSGDKVQFRTVASPTMCWVMPPIISTSTVTQKPTPPPGVISAIPGAIQPTPLPFGIQLRTVTQAGDGFFTGLNAVPKQVQCGPNKNYCLDTNCTPQVPCSCKESNCKKWEKIASDQGPVIDCGGNSVENCVDIGPRRTGDDYIWGGPKAVEGEIGGEGKPYGLANPKAFQWPEFACGRYVIRVYENTGSGFASHPKIVSSPIPLETDRGTSELGAGHLAASSSWHGFVDMDGDGFLDAVYMTPFWDGADGPIRTFQVFRGDGTGHFRGNAQGNPYEWEAPALLGANFESARRARINLRENTIQPRPVTGSPETPARPVTNQVSTTTTTVTLQDLNGDGLPDYVDARDEGEDGQSQVRVFYNTGVGFESPFILQGFRGHMLETSAWGTNEKNRLETTQGRIITPHPVRMIGLRKIWSRTVTKIIDIDLDGLPDLILLPPVKLEKTNPWDIVQRTPIPGQNPPPISRLFINVGDKLVPMGQTEKIRQWWPALARITFLHDEEDNKTWSLGTDFVDQDGDGLPEAYTNNLGLQNCSHEWLLTNQSFPTIKCWSEVDQFSWTTPRDGQGMRLLRRIENGRGGTVQFAYQPLADQSGGHVPAGRVPYPLWVVSTVTVNGGPGAVTGPSPRDAKTPSMQTQYEYFGPVYNQDHRGDWGFRGFRSSKIKGPSGAVSVTHYDYSLHWGGLPVQTQVFDADNGHPHLLTKTTWGADPLLNNKIITHHRREVETRTCRANQNVQDCETTGDPRFDFSFWKAINPNVGPLPAGMPNLPLLYVEESHWAGAARNAETTPGSQGTITLYHLLSTPTEYRLLLKEDQRWVVDPQKMSVGKTTHTYDRGFLVEVQTGEFTDPNPANASVTTRIYDMATGNVQSVIQPNFAGPPAAPGQPQPPAENCTGTTQPPSTSFCYDARKLFVTKTSNELGHQVDATYDLATSVQLSARGPNAKLNGKEGWDRKIDGFGRVLTETVYMDHPENPDTEYLPVVVAKNTYHDAPTNESKALLEDHAGVIAQRRIEFDEDRWTTTANEVDGLGRVVVTKALAGQAPLAMSRFFYDKAGNLVKADLPAPNKAPGSDIVPYDLTYDPQGRRISALRPDQTGQHWVYDGRSTTREDVVTNDRDVVSRTRTLTDVFDRLIRTEEQLTSGDWALTNYEYDGNDNVKLIKNADGIETRMEHDWLSRRVKVIRGGQTWGYGYDKNGNMISIVAPTPPNVPPADFIITINYDALDRPLTRVAGNRGLSSEKLADYGPSSTTYEYDQPGINAIGRLTKVSQPHGVMEFTYEARGLIVGEKRGFSILGGKVQDTRIMARSYNALGALKTLTYADAGPNNAPPTTVNYTYDERGLPHQAQWAGHNGVVGQTQYTASGLVAIRSGKLDDSIEHQMAFMYDDLGRVTQQMVQVKPLNVQNFATLSEQAYTYTGSDDVATWDTTLGAGGPLTAARWTFAHDAQHQLTQATGPLGYQANFEYSPGGRIMSANVNAANTAKRVHRRTVTYDYSQGDPEAPDVLKLPNGNPWMSLVYDPAGNLTQRIIGGKVWQHVNDGADLQREVVRPDGTHELYWYDHGRQRSLIATLSSQGVIGRVRWVFGETEIWYDRAGTVTKTLANVNLNGMLARIEGPQPNRVARFLFQNPRGDVLLALDQQGPVAADFAYGPYGESVEEEGTDSKHVLERFNGKQFDQTSELAYYGYRYYDERSLTWTQADPLYRFAPDIAMDQPRRFATYAFSLNNPLRYLDLNGLQSEPSPQEKCVDTGACPDDPPPPADPECAKNADCFEVPNDFKRQVMERSQRVDEENANNPRPRLPGEGDFAYWVSENPGKASLGVIVVAAAAGAVATVAVLAAPAAAGTAGATGGGPLASIKATEVAITGAVTGVKTGAVIGAGKYTLKTMVGKETFSFKQLVQETVLGAVGGAAGGAIGATYAGSGGKIAGSLTGSFASEIVEATAY